VSLFHRRTPPLPPDGIPPEHRLPAPAGPVLPRRPGGFERVRPLLRPMLARLDQIPPAAGVVVKPVDLDLAAVLHVRGDPLDRLVTHSDLRTWEVDGAVPWAIALHNLRRDPPEPELVGYPPDPLWRVLESPSPYTAANLLRLEELLAEPTPNGAVLIVPSRHVLAARAIASGRDLAAIAEVYEHTVAVATKAGPMALYSDVLWWRRGRLTRIPTVRIDKSVLQAGPADLKELRMAVIPSELKDLQQQWVSELRMRKG
jgi:hypothetical protein